MRVLTKSDDPSKQIIVDHIFQIDWVESRRIVFTSVGGAQVEWKYNHIDGAGWDLHHIEQMMIQKPEQLNEHSATDTDDESI